jgi:Activator of Hsp90 ATPase homolog 1-like protein
MTQRLPSVTIVRSIKAPPAKVYAAITQPKLMIQYWGPDAGPTLNAEADVRPGGRFTAAALAACAGRLRLPLVGCTPEKHSSLAVRDKGACVNPADSRPSLAIA